MLCTSRSPLSIRAIRVIRSSLCFVRGGIHHEGHEEHEGERENWEGLIHREGAQGTQRKRGHWGGGGFTAKERKEHKERGREFEEIPGKESRSNFRHSIVGVGQEHGRV